MEYFDKNGKDNCIGILERLEKLEKNYKHPSAYKATKSLLNLIELEMKDKDNNQLKLKNYKYRATKLLQKIIHIM